MRAVRPLPEGPPGRLHSTLGSRPGCAKVLTASPGADDDRIPATAEERQLSRTAASPPRITVFTRGYPPAHLVGGPARTLFALVETLAADFRFSVITSAFDGKAAGRMRSVKPSQWSTFGHATIWYEREYRISAWRTATLLKKTKPHLVYLNSFFDYRFAILPLFITRMTSRKTPVVLAPRGEFSAGALALKRRKKRIFITAFRMLGLHKVVTWHAVTAQEKANIERVFGPGARIHVAISLRTDFSVGEERYHTQRPSADPHCCSLVFFSRIVPKKNVTVAIRAMPLVKGKVRLSIAGPIEDARYWAECLKLIDNIDDPEIIEYVGAIPADEAISFLSRFDLFVFPTLGENFGHVVLESLAAGTPVIIGNDTPWHHIETAGAGWICDPASPEAVAELIERFLALDESARTRMRTAARALARQVLNDPKGIDANRAMLHALSRTAASPPRITVFTRGYPPAHLVGGPARTLFALVETLAADFRFSVITSAFDGKAAGRMRSVKPSQWSTFGHATIWYEREYRISAWRTATLLKKTKPHLVYLNSFFDYRFAILPLFITRMTSRKTPVVLAPRGEFSAGALALKRRKKRIFITAFRMLGLHKVVTWHASTAQEKANIERVFGPGARIHVAIDLRTDFSVGEERYHTQRPSADPHCCSLVFFSRIVPKKNVTVAIRAMPLVKGKVRLSIAGPIEDARYWAECLKLIDNIDDPEIIEYVGAIPADEAISFLSRFDLFVFPTLGENFGHVVLESLAAGTPVIIGNDTPWHHIVTAGAGWICDPASPEAVAELIERFLALDESARTRMRTAARALARQVLNDPKGIDANRAMLHALTSSKSS